MQPNNKYLNQPLTFWANVKLLNQKLGYSERKTKKNTNPGFVIPTIQQIIQVFKDEGLNSSQLVTEGTLTASGQLLIEYMQYRSDILTRKVKSSLMDKVEAKTLFEEKRQELSPRCPLPYNKQKGEMKDYAFLTGLVNMLIEANIQPYSCNYDPHELTAITNNGFPIRVFSRRVDGAFPSTKNPYAIWEIKEYYYTTTFGSRVADGVYETQLDGWELWEVKTNLNKDIKHYLVVDDYYTWWECGRSYLCRLIDSMHMGLVDEVVFGKEVLERIPILVDEWKATINP